MTSLADFDLVLSTNAVYFDTVICLDCLDAGNTEEEHHLVHMVSEGDFYVNLYRQACRTG